MEKQDGILRWKGLNTTVDRSVLEPGELALCRNLFARSGTLRKRPGMLRLLGESTSVWPPYVPPIDLPWVVQGDLWLRLVGVPVQAVVGDPWLLRIEAVSRTGLPVEVFDTGGLVGLTVEGTADDGVTWTGFDELVLATGGTAPEVTAGWVGGVWEALVEVADADGMESLRLTLTYDGQERDQEELGLEVFDHMHVELPPMGVTPGMPFDVFVSARNAADEMLVWFSGARVVVVWDDGDVTPLVVTAEAGGELVATGGWTDGVAHWRAVLPDRGTAEVLRLVVGVNGGPGGEGETGIVEGFVMVWPAQAQAFQDRVLEIRALDYAGERRTGFAGVGYALTVEGYDAALDQWSSWAGLVTGAGAAPELTAGWELGVWRETLRFEEAEGFSQVRISLLRSAATAGVVTGGLHPVTSAEVGMPGQVAALTAFDVVLAILDDEGYGVQGFDGSLLELVGQDEHEVVVTLTDGASAELDLGTGWVGGVWRGEVMFAAAGTAEELALVVLFDGVEIGRASAVIGAAPPGVAREFAVRLPPGVAPGVEFEVMLTARDAFEALATEFAGVGLSLRWELEDDTTGQVLAPVLTPGAGVELTAGWDGGVWQGQFTLVKALGCEALRLVCVLEDEDCGEAETPCALVFKLTTAAQVTTGNRYQLTAMAMQADGLMARGFTGAECELRLYGAAAGGGSVALAGGVNIGVGWANGYWEVSAVAGAVGQVKWELLHEGEIEDTALVEVVARAGEDDDIPPPPEEEDPVKLTLSGPAKVWPTVQFSIGVRADKADYAGDGAMLTAKPGMVPAAAIGQGWHGGSWEHAGKLADPGVTGFLELCLTWTPDTEGVPEGAKPEDFEQRLKVPIGDVYATITLPAKVRTGRRFTLGVAVSGTGIGVLGGYDGTGYGGVVIEVSADAGVTWVAAPGALGTLAAAGWRGGKLSIGATLGEGFGVNNRLRVAGMVLGDTGPWSVAEIEKVVVTAEKLKVVWHAKPEHLHIYGATGDLGLCVTDHDGQPWAPTPGQVALAVVGLLAVGGEKAGFAGVVDVATGLGLSFEVGWLIPDSWTVTARLDDMDGATDVVLRVYQGADLLGSLMVPLRDDVVIDITVPAEVMVNEVFTLTLTARDSGFPMLGRYAGQNLVLTGLSGMVPLAELLDALTDQAPDFASWWVDGVWTREVYITAVCSDFWIRAFDGGVEVEAELVEVISEEDALLLDLRERQMATGRRIWLLSETHTFAQYQTEVNALAPHFVEGIYSAGAARPTMQANTVANGAGLIGDLIPLVRAMGMVYQPADRLGGEMSQGMANIPDLDLAKAGAVASFTYLGGGSVGDYPRSTLSITDTGWWRCEIKAYAYRLRTTIAATNMTQTAYFYTKHDTGVTEWDNWGYRIPSAPGVYEMVLEMDVTGQADPITIFLGDQYIQPTIWPPAVRGTTQTRGYGNFNSAWALVRYGFTNG